LISRKNSFNILIIGSKEKFTLDYIYFKTFKYLGYDTDFFNIEKSINYRIIAKIKNYFNETNHKLLRKKLISFFKKRKKKYSLIIFFKSIYLDIKTLDKVRTINGYGQIINIFPDDPLDINNSTISNKTFLKTISEFDLFCIWSENIKKKLNKRFRTNILYLPFGYDSLKKYNIKKKSSKRVNEILFIGTYEKKRFDILNKIKFKKNIFGGNWSRFSIKKLKNANISNHIYDKQIANKMNKYAIALNILRAQNLSSHNMKTFEIPAFNGLMLTTRSKEQNSFFKENKSCFMYASINELNKKINFIFDNPNKAEAVRKSGIKNVKKHSYINRTKLIIKELNKINR